MPRCAHQRLFLALARHALRPGRDDAGSRAAAPVPETSAVAHVAPPGSPSLAPPGFFRPTHDAIGGAEGLTNPHGTSRPDRADRFQQPRRGPSRNPLYYDIPPRPIWPWSGRRGRRRSARPLSSESTAQGSLRPAASLAAVETAVRDVHKSLDPAGVARVLANEGLRLTGGDRPCVAVRHGSKVVIEVVSGTTVLRRTRTWFLKNPSRCTRSWLRRRVTAPEQFSANSEVRLIHVAMRQALAPPAAPVSPGAGGRLQNLIALSGVCVYLA